MAMWSVWLHSGHLRIRLYSGFLTISHGSAVKGSGQKSDFTGVSLNQHVTGKFVLRRERSYRMLVCPILRIAKGSATRNSSCIVTITRIILVYVQSEQFLTARHSAHTLFAVNSSLN